MRNPTRRLIYTLGLGWITFAALGLGLRQILAGPAITVVIDRSYCDPAQWQQLADQYVDQVIYVSDFGQVVATPVPTPAEVQALTPNGLPNAAEMQKATDANPNATVLTCGN